jgi:hypothetical protein
VRYGLELASRLHRERLPDLIVQALSEALTSELHGLFVDVPGGEDRVYLLPRVWDVLESSRVVKLALNVPSLLTASERELWNAVKVNSKYWRSGKKFTRSRKATETRRTFDDLNSEELEADWSRLKEALHRVRDGVA